VNKTRLNSQGFTIVELTVVLVVTAIVFTVAFSFFNNAIIQYLTLQKDGMSASELTIQTQRIASVMRGATDVIVASNTEMVINTYFSPNDVYVSQVKYYKSEDGKKLLAEVIPYTVNPPVGSLDNAKTKTYTIIEDFYTKNGLNTFEYINSSGGTMSLPISELHTIKGLRINLISKPPDASNSVSVQVSLRNRKINL
jgi:prepilin-type N-terminal cleavage/methylation domain-containing protein